MLLQGKVALVSGAGPGLGRAICLRFAAEGAKVVVGDVDGPAVSDTVAAVVAAGGEAVGQMTDITDAEQCRALVALGVEQFGGLDVLVNDAYHGGDFQRFEDADLDGWKATGVLDAVGLEDRRAAERAVRDGQDAKDLLIEANLRLVVSIAKRSPAPSQTRHAPSASPSIWSRRSTKSSAPNVSSPRNSAASPRSKSSRNAPSSRPNASGSCNG